MTKGFCGKFLKDEKKPLQNSINSPLPQHPPPFKYPLTTLQTQCRIPILHKRHNLHPQRHNRNRNRQHTSKPRSAPPIAGLFLGRPNPHTQQHLLQHNLSRLTHRLHRLRRQFRSRARNKLKRVAVGFA